MSDACLKRRTAVILALDMAGYSRLIEADEEDVLARHMAHRRSVMQPAIAAAGGRIVKTMGDGLLAELTEPTEAVAAALRIQKAIRAAEAAVAEERRILYRIGINQGDVIVEEDDVYGDAVNVAARLETLARPGGICVADDIHRVVGDLVPAPFHDLGLQRVKNIGRQIRVWQWTPDGVAVSAPPIAAPPQEIAFATAADGVRIAWSAIGRGTPVLKAPNWLNHLDYELQTPVWGPMLAAFAARCRLVRFDQRGNGLSDWEVDDISEEAMIADMAMVADAAGLDRFGLFGISQGGAFSIRYAVEHPERVAFLVLLGAYARGRLRRSSAEEEGMFHAAAAMIRHGWGSPNRAFRQFFVESFMPEGTAEQKASFDELQRLCITPENAGRIWRMNAMVDVSELAPRITVPTLVLHSRDDRMCPLAEGRRMAALIPNARFVEFDGANHVVKPGTPAFDQFFEAFDRFLDEQRAA